ncbi:MAG: glycerol-3-phosphate acyltransferase, partial [Gemmatimonadota bacterium]
MASGTLPPIVAIVLAYASGSLPFAYLAGRLLKGIDLRTVGSGNLGATNVYRTLGAPAAIVVLLLDALKG